jgi:hypothetical protein
MQSLDAKCTAINQECTAINQEWTAINQEWTAINQEWTAINQECTAINQECTAINQECTAIKLKPSQNSLTKDSYSRDHGHDRNSHKQAADVDITAACGRTSGTMKYAFSSTPSREISITPTFFWRLLRSQMWSGCSLRICGQQQPVNESRNSCRQDITCCIAKAKRKQYHGIKNVPTVRATLLIGVYWYL